MADTYRLPGSSYEEIVKIIRAYGSAKNGAALSLADVAQTTGMDKTIISRNNGFLIQLRLITDGNKKSATDTCINLGRAYGCGINEQIAVLWHDIVKSDEFLERMLSTIQIKGQMSKQEFANHIVFSSSNNSTPSAKTGALAIIEILKLTQLIEEKDGMIVEGTGVVRSMSTAKEEKPDASTEKEVSIKRNEMYVRDNQIMETGYYIQSYTCESGKAAKFIIPEDATEDDLLAFEDMLKIVLKRKFKITNNEV